MRFSRVFIELQVFLLLSASNGSADRPQSDPPISTHRPLETPSSGTSYETCKARSVNYITYSPAAVCLKDEWTGVPAQLRTIAVQGSRTSILASSTSSTKPVATTTLGPASTVQGVVAATSQSLEGVVEEALDSASFLSFEDWKKQIHQEGGGDGEIKGTEDARETPDNVEDTAINFAESSNAGDRAGEPTPNNGEVLKTGSRDAARSPRTSDHQSEKPRHRGKDAGKTCRERFNFASKDLGAQVMKSNAEAKGASAVLNENRDAYMLNICHAKNKFFIVELSDSIYVETVALANFEFFSSTFRQFRISVSARYPVKADKWKVLGTYEAQNSRDIQAFLVDTPLIEARYLRVEFLNHYGNEFYCPVSLLRVHGQTMLQEVMSWERAASGQDDEDDADEVEMIDTELMPTTEAVSGIEETKSYSDAVESSHLEETSTSLSTMPDSTHQISGRQYQSWFQPRPTSTSPWQAHNTSDVQFFRSMSPSTCRTNEGTTAVLMAPATSMEATPAVQMAPLRTSDAQPIIHITPASMLEVMNSSSGMTESSASGGVTSADADSTLVEVKISSITVSVTEPSISAKESMTNTNQTVKSTKSPAAPPPQPTTQESFFKTVTKRLQLLETNSTLSLKYVEDQSRMLREAFNRIELRQISKVASFLDALNGTAIAERRKLEQLWQSTSIELEVQRELLKRETQAVTARLNMLADELVFQKRMSIIQSVLLLLCLAFVIFAKSGAGTSIDMTTIQNMLAKTQPASHFTLLRGSEYEGPEVGDLDDSFGFEHGAASPQSFSDYANDEDEALVYGHDELEADAHELVNIHGVPGPLQQVHPMPRIGGAPLLSNEENKPPLIKVEEQDYMEPLNDPPNMLHKKQPSSLPQTSHLPSPPPEDGIQRTCSIAKPLPALPLQET